MELFQEKLLKELVDKYGYDFAQLKQQTGETITNKQEKFEIITFHHFNCQLADIINEYVASNPQQDENITASSIISLLFIAAGDILKQVDQVNKKMSSKMLIEALKKLQEQRKQ